MPSFWGTTWLGITVCNLLPSHLRGCISLPCTSVITPMKSWILMAMKSTWTLKSKEVSTSMAMGLPGGM